MGLGASVHARVVVVLERSPGAADSTVLEPHREVGGGEGQQERGMNVEDTAGASGGGGGGWRRQREQSCKGQAKDNARLAGRLECVVSAEEVAEGFRKTDGDGRFITY